MILPEIHIRLQIDGESVKSYHLSQPYTKEHRQAVIDNLNQHAIGREYKEAFIIFSPVYCEQPNELQFIKETISTFDCVYFLKQKGHNKIASLLLQDISQRARNVFYYESDVTDEKIYNKLMYIYIEHYKPEHA